MSYEYDATVKNRSALGVQSSEFFNTDGYQPAAATGMHYPLLQQPLLLEEHLWARGRTRGPRNLRNGVLELQNADGALDYMAPYAFDDCDVSITRAPTSDRATSAAYFTGRLEQPTFTAEAITFRVRDDSHNLLRPVLTARYGGTNVLPNGLDGGESDINGRVKPWPLGRLFHASPPCVNTTRCIYQSSCKQLVAGWDHYVYVRLVLVTRGISRTLAEMQAGYTTKTYTVDPATNIFTVVGHGYATEDAVSVYSSGGVVAAGLVTTRQYYVRNLTADTFTLHNTAPDATANTAVIDVTGAGTGTQTVAKNRTAEGCWDYTNDASAGFYFRLGTQPDGIVTATIVNPAPIASGAINLTPACTDAEQMYALFGWVASEAFGTVDVTADTASLGTGHTHLSGIWIDSDQTYLECLNQIAETGGAAWVVDGTDFTLFGLVSPSGSGSASIEEYQIFDIERIEFEDDDRGVPAWRVVVEHRKCQTVLSDSDIATSVSMSDREFAKREYRTVVVEDAAIKTQWPRAPEIRITTGCNYTVDATTIANKLLAIYKVKRTMLRVVVPLSASTLPLASMYRITHSRYGLSGGVTAMLIGLVEDAGADRATLFLWY